MYVCVFRMQRHLFWDHFDVDPQVRVGVRTGARDSCLGPWVARQRKLTLNQRLVDVRCLNDFKRKPSTAELIWSRFTQARHTARSNGISEYLLGSGSFQMPRWTPLCCGVTHLSRSLPREYALCERCLQGPVSTLDVVWLNKLSHYFVVVTRDQIMDPGLFWLFKCHSVWLFLVINTRSYPDRCCATSSG